ncbi:MAG: S41 family peptidase [Fimbriimonadales bacterium]
MKSRYILTAIAAIACTLSVANPQGTTLTKAQKDEVIASLSKALLDDYVFPDVAKKMEAAFRDHQRKGEYDSIGDPVAFARTLTEHAQAVSKDKHLRVRHHENKVSLPTAMRPPTQQEIEDEERSLKRINGGFEKVERLQGNVGYVDFRFFGQHPICFKAVDSAFAFLQNTDAMIIDLRQNGGGSPEVVAYICSYLFGEEPVHLNDLYFRPQDETRQYWTMASLPGARYLDKPVYVLTSSNTFSGAEEFSYNLKNLKRATIVGETTGGGAHPGGSRRLSDHFTAFIPSGRAINPITKTNWEGTGVEPDIKVKADDALKTAHADAVGKLLATVKNPEEKTSLANLLDRLKKG